MSKPVAVANYAWVLPGDLTWENLLAGVSAVRSLPVDFPVKVGAPFSGNVTVPPEWGHANMPRAIGLAWEAFSRLDAQMGPKPGLVLGLPNYNSEEIYLEKACKQGLDSAAMATLSAYHGDAALTFFAERIPGCGPRIRVDSACATGNESLIVAHQWLASGVITDCIVLAASAMLSPVGLALFKNLKALSTLDSLDASCPFDARRRGFVMGEGAAAFWLTTRQEVHHRAYIIGYGHRLVAENFIDLPEDLRGMREACTEALGNHSEVAYVCAHGTGTQLNDLRETELHRALFGKKAQGIPLSSVKSMIGHTLGAAALINAGVCVSALENQMAPPTINHSVPDPNCDLNYVPNTAQSIKGSLALSNAFAFGGQHTSVLFARDVA